jgi:biotin carboxyl carrier protein
VTFEVEIHGRVRRVSVERRDGGFVVEVDGRKHIADVSRMGDTWSLILEPAKAGPHQNSEVGPGFSRSEVGAGFSRLTRRSYEISISERPGSGILTVHVNGRPVTVSIAAGRGTFSRRAREGAAAGGTGLQQIAAPMPGKVVKLLVKSGDEVAPRQGLVVVEAMKMENELRSPKAGKVVEVRVSEGSSVEAGAVLVVVE